MYNDTDHRLRHVAETAAVGTRRLTVQTFDVRRVLKARHDGIEVEGSGRSRTARSANRVNVHETRNARRVI